MKKKYHLSDASGKQKIFSSFNQMLRYLKVTEEDQIRLAEVIGKTAFAGNEEISYKDDKLGITIDYH